MLLMLGLYSWLLVGLATGLLANAFLPGHPRLGFFPAALTGLCGALAGGFLATVLGFGGLMGFDVRALVTATLGAALALLLLRFQTLPTAS
jgi:uncharacterized membrane protein YeaQ/YmgE (transglycosylase-associated protein family)